MPRPHKGHRVRIVTRVPVDVHLKAVQAAARDKLTLSEWVDQTLREKVAR